MPFAAAMVMSALVPPTQIFAGLAGWVVMAGSPTTVTVATSDVASPQSLPVADTTHLY